MITELQLQFGPSPEGPPLTISLQPSITVFVGPNNSGKSLLLREIASYCSGAFDAPRKILGRLKFSAVDDETAKRELEEIRSPDLEGEQLPDSHVRVRAPDGHNQVYLHHYFEGRRNPDGAAHYYTSTYARQVTKHLDGKTRLSLLNNQQLGNLKRPDNLLSSLLVDNALRSKIRAKIYDQLNLYLALDISQTPTIGLRLGLEPPPNERSFEEETIQYMSSAPSISAFSDGVRAFCGILVHMHVGASRAITVDEPEAFLAPPLAHALGRELAIAARDEGKLVFASTHSPHFLAGAISSGARVNIVRLTYSNQGKATARLLEAGELTKLMNDPMLRSANVLSALFYRGAIVTEADADRAFYQECNERMLAVQDGRATKDTIFLNANGKDVVPMIVQPLRRLGIPVASIVDLDVLKKGGEVWTRHLRACGIPQPDHQPFGIRRQNALVALETADPAYKTKGGLAVLAGEPKSAALALVNELARYGMFVVERGEVEAWLTSLDAPRSKSAWLHSIFEKMGNDPSEEAYVSPGTGDVWEFIGSAAAWLSSNQ